MQTISIHLLSDIHLEKFGNSAPKLCDLVEGKADCLCLCGDIGDPFSITYERFLKQCADAEYRHVFIILGNHEYYHSYIEKVTKRLREMCNEINESIGAHEPKLIFLQNDKFDILGTNITVIGSTLWSKIIELERFDVYGALSDFRYIGDFKCVDDYNQQYHHCLQHIQRYISMLNPDRQAIVLTHHAPAMICGNPKHHGSTISSAFKNNLDDYILTNTNRIIAWFYGHDHYSMDSYIGSTRIVSNQLGYLNEKPYTKHKPIIFHLKKRIQ